VAVRPRILLIGSFPPPDSPIVGGIRTACDSLLASTLPDRWDLALIDSTMQSIPKPPLFRRILGATHRCGLYLKALFGGNPDAVVMFTAGGLGFVEKSLYAMLATMAGVPSLMWMVGGEFMTRNLKSPWYRRFAALLLRWPTLLLSPGPTWQRFYAQTFGIPKERCPTIESWIGDQTLFDVYRQPSSNTNAPVSIVFVGWIERAKGVFELISAASRLAVDPALPKFKITLIGGGGALQEAADLVDTLGLMHLVTLTGWISDVEKRETLTNADIFVLPTHAEGLPLAMLEAMVVGLPVITTPVGSIPDVVSDGNEGLLIPVGDIERLVGALADLLRNPAERERMGKAAKSRAASFSVETAVTQLDRVVRRAIHKS
ncbi:MAG: glycosyltransferase family 4 protein, partial [Gemmatimonadota bacterium]